MNAEGKTGEETQISLHSFFVYNPTYGCKENEEHKNILFYHPPDTDLDTQIRNVGLGQAMVAFVRTFSTSDCEWEAVHTQKTRQVYYEPEPNFWMTLIVNVPVVDSVSSEGETYTEYREDDVQNTVMLTLLKQAYNMYKLFMGTFQWTIDQSNIQGLKTKLTQFYSWYLTTLRLYEADLSDVHNGILFLPLDKNTYLRVQSFVNLTEATFSCVKQTVFLYNDLLVWSGLDQADMRTLYRYLTASLFPDFLETEMRGNESPQQHTAPVHNTVTSQFGKYMLGGDGLSGGPETGRFKHIHISCHGRQQSMQLVVYKALSATVCLMVESDVLLNAELLHMFDSFIGPQLSSLASNISELYSHRRQINTTADPAYKFIYFNQMNLAQKSTVHSKKCAVNIAVDNMRLLCDINTDFIDVGEDGEIIAKTASDCWVVGKKSDNREIYVILNQKNANLIEVNEEVKKLCATHFNNIFFLE